MFDIVLREKPYDEGLTRSEVIDLFDMLNSEQAFLVEIQSEDHGVAMGYITTTAAEKLNYAYESSGLNSFIMNILDDMNHETEDCKYEFKGLKIWLSR